MLFMKIIECDERRFLYILVFIQFFQTNHSVAFHKHFK